ncbi:MAG: hypothetical protein AAF741_09670 [Bacteroidota bacterium]
MGGATHGTSEFYRFKNQLFRLLVAEAGFKAIVFEIPWGNALTVNDFVLNGIVTAEIYNAASTVCQTHLLETDLKTKNMYRPFTC